jgi:hypothetical protein
MLQGAKYDETTERGCLRRIHPRIKISRTVLSTRGRQRGCLREVYSQDGGPSRLHPCYGSTGNVRPSIPAQLPISSLRIILAGSGKSVLWFVIICQLHTEDTYTAN